MAAFILLIFLCFVYFIQAARASCFASDCGPGSSNGTLQPTTIFGIALGVFIFIALLSVISTCIRRNSIRNANKAYIRDAQAKAEGLIEQGLSPRYPDFVAPLPAPAAEVPDNMPHHHHRAHEPDFQGPAAITPYVYNPTDVQYPPPSYSTVQT